MSSYITIPIEVSVDGLVADMVAEYQAQYPGWVPAEGSPEMFQARALAMHMVAPLADMASEMPDAAFAKFGAKIHNVPAIEAGFAEGTSTWTMIDDSGWTIEAGTQVLIADDAGVLHGFEVRDEVQVLAGSTVTSAGEVVLDATEQGVESNDLTGSVQPVEGLAYFASAVLTAPTDNGVDGEDFSTYLNRLRDTLQTLSPQPILARDTAILARSIAGVTRALPLDNYDPDDVTDDPDDPETWNSLGVTTVAVQGPDGADCSDPVKEAVEAMLSAKRGINFTFHVIDPTRTSIKVNFRIVTFSGFDQATAEANVISALSTYLAPGNWGKPQFSTGGDDQAVWIDQPVVRYQDLSTVINTVPGVNYHTHLRLAKTGDALGTADVPLDQPAGLPTVGVIVVGD